jgi:hypothetical protein
MKFHPEVFCGRQPTLCILALGLSAFLAKADFFVSDFNNDVVDHYGQSGSLVNVSSIVEPAGLAIGPGENLYVATPVDSWLARMENFMSQAQIRTPETAKSFSTQPMAPAAAFILISGRTPIPLTCHFHPCPNLPRSP